VSDACVFIPGLVMPASLRYKPLIRALGEGAGLIAQDMAVVGAGPGYSMRTEIDALEEVRQAHRLERFHLYGHSAGGAVALAYVAAHPDRVISLALDEPSTDFSDEDLAWPGWAQMRGIREMSFTDGMTMFRRLQVGPMVPAALPAEPPAWMSVGPERVAAFSRAVADHRIAAQRYSRFPGLVRFTYGSLSHPRFGDIRDRLARAFPRFSSERIEALHHLRSEHQAMPDAVARSLRSLWSDLA
jgi:pimeloyl-ACP methyl ester carboxylesterase